MAPRSPPCSSASAGRARRWARTCSRGLPGARTTGRSWDETRRGRPRSIRDRRSAPGCRSHADGRRPTRMYTLVRRFLKTAIAFLGVGLAIGGWMLVRRELWSRFPTPYEVSAHTHAILVGFVMMMILGVALWLFPRPEKGDERYDPRAAEAAYWLVTTGTAARVLAELLRPSVGAAWLRWAVVVAGLAQALGIALFFFTM